MNKLEKIIASFIAIFLFINIQNISFSDENELKEMLLVIQKDLKTLEKAVYSKSTASTSQQGDSDFSEDTLTRHLLKLSDIEQQFQELTNKFEEINFKIDKLSGRISKIQADNQLRFQDLEGGKFSAQQDGEIINNQAKKILPGSSEAQDLGRISDEDLEKAQVAQKTQSIDSTKSVVTEKFESEEKILPPGTPTEQYDFALSLLKVGDYETAELALR